VKGTKRKCAQNKGFPKDTRAGTLPIVGTMGGPVSWLTVLHAPSVLNKHFLEVKKQTGIHMSCPMLPIQTGSFSFSSLMFTILFWMEAIPVGPEL
jgi:hypothetical protein